MLNKKLIKKYTNEGIERNKQTKKLLEFVKNDPEIFRFVSIKSEEVESFLIDNPNYESKTPQNRIEFEEWESEEKELNKLKWNLNVSKALKKFPIIKAWLEMPKSIFGFYEKEKLLLIFKNKILLKEVLEMREEEETENKRNVLLNLKEFLNRINLFKKSKGFDEEKRIKDSEEFRKKLRAKFCDTLITLRKILLEKPIEKEEPQKEKTIEEKMIEKEEEIKRFKERMDRAGLTILEKKVMYLKFFKDKTPKEIGKIIERETNNVYVIIKRASDKIRKM